MRVKLGRLGRIERVEVQRYRPGERAEEPAHLRSSRQLLDADADEDALCGSGRADERGERRPGRRSHDPARPAPAQRAACRRRRARRAHSAPRHGRAGVRTAARGAASRRPPPRAEMSVPSLVDRNPTARKGSPTSRARSPFCASRSSRAHPVVPIPTQLTLSMRSSAGRRPISSETARSSTTTCPTRSVERGAGKSDAEAREQDGAGLAAIRRAATARSNDPPRHPESLGSAWISDERFTRAGTRRRWAIGHGPPPRVGLCVPAPVSRPEG